MTVLRRCSLVLLVVWAAELVIFSRLVEIHLPSGYLVLLLSAPPLLLGVCEAGILFEQSSRFTRSSHRVLGKAGAVFIALVLLALATGLTLIFGI